MNITRDVIIDLLPAYQSGEASADTRALIDEMAARDPDIARLVASAQEERTDVMSQNMSLPPNLERDIVNRTRAVLRRRSWTLALAIVLTVLPMTFTFGGGGITFLLMRDEPGSRLLWLGAAWFWFDYVRLTWRLHTKLPA